MALIAASTVANASLMKWHACDSNPAYQCGDLKVPLDYQIPAKGSIVLPVIYIPALKSANGTLYFNSGGPWGDFVKHVQSFYRDRFPNELKQSFDIIAFNPRSVSPNAVLCQSNDMQALYNNQNKIIKTFPGDKQGASTLYNLINYKNKTCNFGPLAAYTDTKATVKDLEHLRELLQIKHLDFYTASYGTHLALDYLLQYPTHVGRMILDGNMLPNNDLMASTLSRAAGLDTNLNGFFTFCAAAKKHCPLYHKAPQEMLTAAAMRTQYQKLMSGAEVNALPTSKKYDGRGFTASMFTILLTIDMEHASTWPALASALNSAIVNGNADLLMQQYIKALNGKYDVKTNVYKVTDKQVTDVNAPVLCVDYLQPGGASKTSMLKQISYLQKASPLLGGVAMTTKAMRCVGWPIAPNPLFPNVPPSGVDAKGATVMIFTNKYDPVTPQNNAWAVWNYLKDLQVNVHMVTWNGVGHTTILANSPRGDCPFKMMDQFLMGTQIPRVTHCSNHVNPFLPKVTYEEN